MVSVLKFQNIFLRSWDRDCFCAGWLWQHSIWWLSESERLHQHHHVQCLENMFRCKYKTKEFHNTKTELIFILHEPPLSLQCNFAIVQYGSSIRTELSLLDNEDGARSLQKVKEIKQIYNLTKTASAINHVLWVYKLLL